MALVSNTARPVVLVVSCFAQSRPPSALERRAGMWRGWSLQGKAATVYEGGKWCQNVDENALFPRNVRKSASFANSSPTASSAFSALSHRSNTTHPNRFDLHDDDEDDGDNDGSVDENRTLR